MDICFDVGLCVLSSQIRKTILDDLASTLSCVGAISIFAKENIIHFRE
jgi:hypothetical protein